jgi:anti-anti-sigma factor
LPGSIKLYQRHMFVCTGNTDWPAHIEEGGGFLQLLATSIAQRSADMPLQVKVTACDEPSFGPGYDLLVFPDQVRYLNVQESDLPVLIEDHFEGGRVSSRIPHVPVTGHNVFVCVHAARDMRCGVAGPPVAEVFQASLEARGLAEQVAVRRTSHVGGHKYAGNLLIFPSGDWYGYVTPVDVERIIDQHIVAGAIVWDLWRGRMGLSPEEQLRLSRIQSASASKRTHSISNGGSANMEVSTSLGPVTVVSVKGDIDSDTFRRLVEQATQVIDQGYNRLVLDLQGVNYISSGGLVAIQTIAGKAEGQGGKVVLCGLTRQVARVLELAAFGQWLRIFPDVSTAKANFSAA